MYLMCICMCNTFIRLYNDKFVVVQPIADRVALNLEIVSKKFQFSTKRTRIYHLLLGTNRKSHGQNYCSLETFQK